MEYGCGQCKPCRINKSRLWVGRMLLELNEHENSAFVTLTYSDDSLPVGAVLVKQDLQKFLKRLRWYLEERPIRYFAVGEYGSASWRPHYHLIIFGLAPTEGPLVEKAWTKGFVHIGTAEAQSMTYVCSYVLKNMRNVKDRRLCGRPPEFSLLSKRPGLGHGIVARYTKAYHTAEGRKALADHKWFGEGVRIAGKRYPLGRYLKEKIQKELKLDKVSKKAYNRATMYKMYAKKSTQTTTEYEIQRKAKVSQQMGNVRHHQITI